MINILAVENDSMNASQIYSALSDRRRYHLAICESGYTALEAVGQKTFDLIIIARDLPYLSGLKTARTIRKRIGMDVSPFIITAPSFEREEINEFIPTGVFDFWEQPLRTPRIKLAADSAPKWQGTADNLQNFKEYLQRNGWW